MMGFRPDDIGKIFGQDHLLELLLSWTEDIRQVPQSVLFAGPYGVGKTSIARIFANKITSSKADLKEINAADARGIEDVRSWAELAKFSPLGEGGKVFIIDEMHQLTSSAQNALLKVIEEPPANIYFFLCTTEPFKLIPTIKSRCTVLELKTLSLHDTRRLLTYVFASKLSKDIIDAIHVKSGGHARDAVKMAEIALMTNVVNLEDLNQKVGFGRSEIENIFLNLFKTRFPVDKLQILSSISDNELVVQIMDYMVDMAVMEANPLALSMYHDLLTMRVAKRDHKISAIEQITHFIARYLSVGFLKEKAEI